MTIVLGVHNQTCIELKKYRYIWIRYIIKIYIGYRHYYLALKGLFYRRSDRQSLQEIKINAPSSDLRILF